MQQFKPTKWKAHFATKDNGHWYEMECKHCGWMIAVPKRESGEVLADRNSQLGEHIQQSHMD